MLIHCISLRTLALLLIPLKLKTISFTVARLATVETNTLVCLLNVFGWLLHVAKLHGDYIWVPIFSGMVNSLLLTALIRLWCAILEPLDVLLLIHGRGEVKGYFSSLCCHDCVCYCGWLVEKDVHSNLRLQSLYKLIQSICLCHDCVT